MSRPGWEDRPLWNRRDMDGAYVELDHPADVWLEVRADTLPTLFEHALYAFYRQVVDLDGVRPTREVRLEADGESVEDCLRALLTEALFLLETEGFLAAGAHVCTCDAEGPRMRVTVHLWGETADRARHSLLAEVKAVTYHRLTVDSTPAGWRATVLLDV